MISSLDHHHCKIAVETRVLFVVILATSHEPFGEGPS